MGWAKDVIFREDFFERVVNVKWSLSDGVFVGGDWYGGMFSGDIKSKKEQTWSGITPSMFSSDNGIGDVRGSSFAMVNGQPVFVLVGNFVGNAVPRDDPEDPKADDGWDAGALIMVSNDGLSWRHAMHKYSNTLFATKNGCFFTHSLYGVVWNGSAFYAAGLKRWDTSESGDDPRDDSQPVMERIYSSSDGESWDMVGESLAYHDSGDPPWHRDVPSKLSRYCKMKKNKGGIPDGIQGYDRVGKILMKPASLTGYCIEGPLYDGEISWKTTPSGEVLIEKDSAQEGEEPQSGSPGGACYAVGYGNNLWAAALGGGSVAVSFDRGKKWENGYSGGQSWTLTVAGAKYKDVHGDQR